MFRIALFCLAALVASTQVAHADPVTNALGSLSYRSIGPAIGGGRATAVAGSDRNPFVYYLGGAGGGVFKSVDGGASWTPTFDKQPVAPIGAIAVNPRDDNDVWVGTGEAYPRNTAEEGAGIFHSTDGGKTWTHMGLAQTASIANITIDPRDPRVVAVGVLGRIYHDSNERGVYVTRDAGRTWSHTLSVGPSSGVSDLRRVPDHPSTLFAGVWQFRRYPWTFEGGGPNGGLYRSDDNGATWRKVVGNGFPTGLTGRIGVAPANGGRVYAIVQSKLGDTWRSDDGGTHWSLMPHSALVGARPFYFTRLYVDPANRDRVISVGLVLSMSTDGAKTFKLIAPNAGWDYHYAWWSQDGRRVYVASDEGLVMSANGAKTFWQSYDVPFTQPYRVGFDATIPYYNLCLGLQDDNTWCGPSTSSNTAGVLNRDWTQIAPGDGMWAVFDPKDSNLVWSTSTASDTGQVFLSNLTTKQAYEVSPDAELNGRAVASLKYRSNWDTPVAFTNDGKALVGGNVVFESADHGKHWTAISPDLTRNDKSHQQAAGGPISKDMSGAETADTLLDVHPSKLADGLIWASSDDGLVHLTRDGGAHWTDVTPKGMPHWARVPTVETGHASAATAYIAVENHMLGDNRPYIYMTDDYGATWSDIAGDLPNEFFVRSIREDLTNRNLLYAGTRRGIFVTFDRGRHWHPMRLNMPATAIYDLEIQPQANDLIVASHGRGLWILDDLRPLQELARGIPQTTQLYAPRTTYRMWRTTAVNTFQGPPPLPSNEFVGENVEYGAIISYYLPRAEKNVKIEIVDASGRVIRHLSGKSVPGKVGLNRAAWDLNEDAPVKWKATFKPNQGPETGPEVVPGTYTVHLLAGGATFAQTVEVKADPRDTSGPQDAKARYDYLTQLYAELSEVDTWLNTIDAELKHASGARATELRAFRARLTIDPRNVEDLSGAEIRERIGELGGRISTSYQAPNEAQTQEAAAVRADFLALSSAYHRLMGK